MSFSIEQCAPHLRYLVAQTNSQFAGLAGVHEAYAPGKWTRLELLGHLIDSAINNQQRIVRGLYLPEVGFPGYDQEAMVRAQDYRNGDPEEMLQLWTLMNRRIASHMEKAESAALANQIHVGTDPAISLEQLMLDYVAHLEHHLRQMFGSQAMLWSGLPWSMSV
jgi:hypothetical protein